MADTETGRFYSITDHGDTEPWALVAVRDRGLYEMWVAGTGWVDMPYFATYFGGGDTGAREVDSAEAERLQGIIQAPPPTVIDMLRGKQ